MMRFFWSIFALVVPLLVEGAPVRRAANSADVLVLQFAGVLEQLETEFYSQALAKFQTSDFTAAGFSDVEVPIQQFQAIGSDEATHLSIINSTLQSMGASLISGCQFDFSNALTSVSTMAATARVVENLGVSAYLGAASMISDPIILTAAASIMTVEARHQTILNVLNNATSIPQAFDIALNPSEVLAVASPFISGCDVPIPANPTLTVTNTAPALPGSALSFASSALNGSTSGYSCQMLIGGAAFSISLPFDNCVVPAGINGPVALFITSDDQPIDNDIREQNTNTIVAGPAMVFIDLEPDALGEMAISGMMSSGETSSSSSSSDSPASSASASASTSIASAASSSVVTTATTASSSAVSSASISTSSVISSVSISTSSASAISTASASASAVSSIASIAASGTDIGTAAITTTISPSQASAIISAASAESAVVTASAVASGVASASAAAPAASSSAAAGNSTGASTDVVAFPGGPNMYKGPTADGTITVIGWSTTPAS